MNEDMMSTKMNEDISDVESNFNDEHTPDIPRSTSSEDPKDNDGRCPQRGCLKYAIAGISVAALIIILSVFLLSNNTEVTNDPRGSIAVEVSDTNPDSSIGSSTAFGNLVGSTMTSQEMMCERLKVLNNLTNTDDTSENWIELTPQILGDSSYHLSGWALDMSDDGLIVAVSSVLASSEDNLERAGHVRVYQRDDVSMAYEPMGSDIEGEGEKDQFGYSVTLARNGLRLAAGGRWNDGISGENSVHVRIFDFIDNDWKQVGQDIDGEAAGDQSGRSVSFAGDGMRIAIGSPGSNGDPITNNNQTEVGHVRVFELDDGTKTWQQIGQNMNGDGDAENTGSATSLSDDGQYLSVGTFKDDGYGSVRVFKYESEPKLWKQVGSKIMGAGKGDWTGFSVSMSPNGGRVAIGSPGDSTHYGAGYSHVYEFRGGEWEIMGDGIVKSSLDGGYSVALTQNGNRVVVGDYKGMDRGPNSGYCHVYDWKEEANEWVQVGSVIDGDMGDLLGSSVATSKDGNRIVVSAPNFQMQRGATRVYQLC